MKLLGLFAICMALFVTFATCADDNDTKDSPTPGLDMTNSVNLDGNDVYWLYWKYDSEMITFEVHVRTAGYIGLGFGDNGGMAGADIVLGWVKDGRTYLTDRHAVGNSMPLKDSHQDYKLVRSEEKNGFTILRFYRKLDTCDGEDYIITDGTIRLIYAWSDEDPVNDQTIHQHRATHRGTKSVLLLSTGVPKLDLTGLQSYDLIHDKVAVPAIITYYHCKNFKLPDLNKKHHVVRVHPVIQKENLHNVHHMVIYQCKGVMAVDHSNGYNCFTIAPDDPVYMCFDLAYVWGIGQDDFQLPDTAGMPLGELDEEIYYKMEVHYDNPLLLADIVDSSGLRLYYTDTLREHDVGILSVGHALYWPPVVIPPGMTNFSMHSFCDSSCTNRIPDAGVRVFGSFPHTHLAGVGIYTELIRDGKHIDHLGQDTHYDFDYQTMRLFKEEKLLLPGDQLQTTCVYDTTNRDYVSFGGVGSYDEMCMNFIYYYPRMKLEGCVSMTQTLEKWMDFVNTKAREQGWNKRPTYADVIGFLPNITWTQQDREHVRNMEKSETYTQYCGDSSQQEFGSEETKQPDRPRPEIRGPYFKSNPLCEAASTPPGDGISGADNIPRVTMVTLLTGLILALFH